MNPDTPFTINGKEADFTILDFWKWGCSSILDNVWRGVLAEYIIAKALGIDNIPRKEWETYDLITPEGKQLKTNRWKPGSLGIIINQYKRIVTINARKITPDFGWGRPNRTSPRPYNLL